MTAPIGRCYSIVSRKPLSQQVIGCVPRSGAFGHCGPLNVAVA
jgi:hypothetical protein